MKHSVKWEETWRGMCHSIKKENALRGRKLSPGEGPSQVRTYN